MSDDRIQPRIMASTTVRPTLVVAPLAGHAEAHSPELTPGISTSQDVRDAVVGMTWKSAKKLLEPQGFIVRALSTGEVPAEPVGSTGECVDLTVVDGKVTDAALA
jgi:hypothetical protein